MDFTEQIAFFEASGSTCMLFRDGMLLRAFSSHGIMPLMHTLQHEPQLLQGTTVTDKVIGRAAALLCVQGGAVQVYGSVMSEGAAKVLEEAGIEHRSGTMVPFIENRDKTDMCPMEKKVQHTADAGEAYGIFSQFFDQKVKEQEALRRAAEELVAEER